MTISEQLQIESLLRTFGTQPYGTPGFSPFNGGIPPLAQFPPGASYAAAGSFFGPQQYNPHHLAFGSGFMGQAVGFGMEQFGQSRGYTYVPPNINMMDFAQGRALESGMRLSAASALPFDENRLAIAFERAMRMVGLAPSGGLTAHAGAVAGAVAGPLQQIGILRHIIPGGTAADFASQMYLTGQNMRDYTRQNFHLGLPDTEIRGMTNRLLNYFAPTGDINLMQTRGMGFGELGQMAGTLSSFGLIRTDRPTQQQILQYADRAGIDPSTLTGANLDRVRELTRAGNVGKQLKDYAEITGSLREIMGKDSPIQTIIENLQQLTGGGFQGMKPDAILGLLDRIKETARAANISMDVMMEMAKMGSDLYQKMGMSGVAGANVTLNSAAATVAMQTAFPGQYPGRMAPDVHHEQLRAMDTRLQTSPAVRVNAQTIMALEQIDQKSLNPQQQATYTQLMDLAQKGGLSSVGQNGIAWVSSKLQELGFSPTDAMQRLRSTMGVSEFLDSERGQGLMDMGQEQQRREAQKRFQMSGVRAYRQGAGGVVSNELDALGAQANMSGQAMARIILGSIQEADPGSGYTGMAAAIKRQTGVDVPEQTIQRFISGNFASQESQNLQMGLGITGGTVEERIAKIQQVAGFPGLKVAQATEARVDMGVQGQRMLRDLNAEFRGGLTTRIAGAVKAAGLGGASAKDLIASAVGFVPADELIAKLKESGLDNMAEGVKEMEAAKARGDKPAEEIARKKIVSGAEALDSLVGEGGPLASLDQVGALTKLVGVVDDPAAKAAIATLNDPNATDAQKTEAVRAAIGVLGKMSPDVVSEAALMIGGREGEQLKSGITMLQTEAGIGQNLVDQLDKTTDPAKRRALEEKIGGGATAQVLAGLSGAAARVGESYTDVLGRGKYTTAKGAVTLLKETIEATQSFLDVKKEDLGTPEGQRKFRLARAKHKAAYGVFFDEDGNIRDDMIWDIARSNPSLKTQDEKIAWVDSFRAALKGVQRNASSLESLDPMFITVDAMGRAQDDMQSEATAGANAEGQVADWYHQVGLGVPLSERGKGLNPDDIMEYKQLTPEQIIEKKATDPFLRVVEAVRGVFSQDFEKQFAGQGLTDEQISLEQVKQASRVLTSRPGMEKYMKDGTLTPEAMEAIMSTSTPEAGKADRGMMQRLAEISYAGGTPEVWADEIAKSKKEFKEAEKAKEDKGKAEQKISFVNMDGTVLKELKIVVETVAKDASEPRQAAGKATGASTPGLFGMT